MKINTPDLYEKFVSGLIGTGYQDVYILPGAHPNIMSLPKLFSSNTSFDRYRFEDQHDNVVTVNTVGVVVAHLKNGVNLTLGLPSDYTQYHIFISNRTSLSSDDYDYIINWRDIVYLELIDSTNDIALDLYKRLEDLKHWQKLIIFKLKLLVASYDKMEVGKFVQQIPSVALLDFNINGTLSLDQAEEFKSIQKLPNRYSMTLYVELGWISIFRRGRIDPTGFY